MLNYARENQGLHGHSMPSTRTLAVLIFSVLVSPCRRTRWWFVAVVHWHGSMPVPLGRPAGRNARQRVARRSMESSACICHAFLRSRCV